MAEKEVIVKLTIQQAVMAYTELSRIDGSEYGIVRCASATANRIGKALWNAGYDTGGRRRE